jgi:peptide/nickel transport system permease protein
MAIAQEVAVRPAERSSRIPLSWTLRIGLAGMALMVLAAIFAPLICRYSPTVINPVAALQGPSAQHWFGTDDLGRDIFARVVYGARIDLQIGVIGVAIPFVLGTIIGLVSGFLGGWVDTIVGRVIDIVMAFPFFVLAIAIVAMLGPGLRSLYIAIALVSWVTYARIVRGEVLSVRERPFVLAAMGLGYDRLRILTRHVLPNVLSAAIIFSMSDFMLDILVGASLGFFGLGVRPPTAEWGLMISEGNNFIITDPWLVFFPGLAIVLVGFFMSLVGDGVADRLRRVDDR